MMLGLIENFSQKFDETKNQDLFLTNLDNGQQIICEVGVEQKSNNPVESNKHENGGFLHLVAQVVSRLNLDQGVCGSLGVCDSSSVTPFNLYP